MKQDLDSDDQLFLGVFQGEQVAIITRAAMQDDGTTPVSFSGFLIAVDDNFLYIGETVNQITQAVARDKIVAVIDMAYVAAQNEDVPPIGEMN